MNAAIQAFSEHGFEGTSIDVLTKTMGMGRQSVYHEFGDKWRLYLAALRQYTEAGLNCAIDPLRKTSSPLEGLRASLEALIDAAIAHPSPRCFFLIAVCEFGSTDPEVTEMVREANRVQTEALQATLEEAKRLGEVAAEVDSYEAAKFLVATCAGIRISARIGTPPAELRSMARMAIRSLTSASSN